MPVEAPPACAAWQAGSRVVCPEARVARLCAHHLRAGPTNPGSDPSAAHASLPPCAPPPHHHHAPRDRTTTTLSCAAPTAAPPWRPSCTSWGSRSTTGPWRASGGRRAPTRRWAVRVAARRARFADARGFAVCLGRVSRVCASACIPCQALPTWRLCPEVLAPAAAGKSTNQRAPNSPSICPHRLYARAPSHTASAPPAGTQTRRCRDGFYASCLLHA